jgi:hypothetical protein
MQLLRECWSYLTKLMTCQNLLSKLLNITVLFIWYLLASLKKMSLYFILASTCFSPYWRVFEKHGFPHWGTRVSSTNKTDCHDITEILLKVALNSIKPNQTNCLLSCWELLLKYPLSSFHMQININRQTWLIYTCMNNTWEVNMG